MRFYRPCFFVSWLYPGALFRARTKNKELCLTFDDGPDPDSTPEILKILSVHRIKAVFFCNGMAAENYPSLMDKIRAGGHLIGNHGYQHLRGFKTSREIYRRNVDAAAPFTSAKVFRPPFGQLKPSQYHDLRINYKIFFWDIMPYDFDDDSGGKNPLVILRKMIRPGSVIVLHDTSKSTARAFLNDFAVYSLNNGYRFFIPPCVNV